MIPMMRAPMPCGGTAVFLVAHIGGAISNKQNNEWTDVYIEPYVGPVTIDMDVDAFSEMWLTALVSDAEDFDELGAADIDGTSLH